MKGVTVSRLSILFDESPFSLIVGPLYNLQTSDLRGAVSIE